ncbi:hypothetical protein PsorP6_006820 [Peronosclerospora sorghi]|uniref:Uncharacterized protein n=1 Tax=Peronosclerospora sorghi TaxID=230839 RepID=A0ACC0W790_9STRA|nr:hypothetical protein PsorP6_006820 [Peronosclerospora sorghi]
MPPVASALVSESFGARCAVFKLRTRKNTAKLAFSISSMVRFLHTTKSLVASSEMPDDEQSTAWLTKLVPVVDKFMGELLSVLNLAQLIYRRAEINLENSDNGLDGMIAAEAVVFLEATVDPEWLDPCWKTSPLPSAKNAITTSTIASVTMPLYSLDEAISYGRVKRASKRKHRTISRMSARQAQKSVIRCYNSTSAANGTTRSDLPLFISTSSPGVVALATKMIQKILEVQIERSWKTLMYRKAPRKVDAIASLTEEQVEQWIQASLSQIAAASEPCRSGSLGPPKSRKRHAPTSATVSRSVDPPHNPEVVELRCYQMKTFEHCFRLGAHRIRRSAHVSSIYSISSGGKSWPDPLQVPCRVYLVTQRCSNIPWISARSRYERVVGIMTNDFEHLVRDVNLVWDNCFTFNRRDADIAESATRLQSISNRLFEQWITSVPLYNPVAHLASEELCRHCGHMHAKKSCYYVTAAMLHTTHFVLCRRSWVVAKTERPRAGNMVQHLWG